MDVRIQIECDNAAFFGDRREGDATTATGTEIARILRSLAKRIEGRTRKELEGFTRGVSDANGLNVGQINVLAD